MNFSLEKATIGIIGLGYVGLPLAVEFGKKYQTLGFDINNPPKAQSGQELHRARNSLAQASSGANNLLRQKQPHRRGLLMDDDENLSQEDEIGTALTEPTPECRRILNVWTSKCVFGGGGFGSLKMYLLGTGRQAV